MVTAPSLSDALAGLFEFLTRQGCTPPTRDVVLIEVDPAATDERGRVRVRADAFRTPAEYAPRFAELVRSSSPWINVSCYGVWQGKLVVALERSTSTPGRVGRTSLNYSGPAAAVLDNSWSVDPVLVFE